MEAMMNLKQLGVVIVIGVSAAAGFFAARAYEQSKSAAAREADMTQAANVQAALRSDAESWAGSIAQMQGETVLRSFVAGLTPLLLAERHAGVEIAGTSLLRLRGVQGISILRSDGKVLYASDAKLTVSDDGNEQTRWALSATDFSIRDSVQPGIKEMSLPVNDAGQLLAVVWLAYDAATIRDQDRPASLKDAADSGTSSSTTPSASTTESVER
jgi:hypothetical protein